MVKDTTRNVVLSGWGWAQVRKKEGFEKDSDDVGGKEHDP